MGGNPGRLGATKGFPPVPISRRGERLVLVPRKVGH